MIRHIAGIFFVIALLTSLTTFAAPAAGALYISDQPSDSKSPTFEKDVKRRAKASLAKVGEGWHLYFVAYLKKPAASDEVNLVFYEAGGQREQVNAFSIQTQAGAKILMAEIDISPEQGFKTGKKYDVRLTQLTGGKEYIYARAVLELR